MSLRIYGFTLLVAALLVSGPSFAAGKNAPDFSGSLRDAVDSAVAKVKPALVRIRVVSTSYRDGREQKYQSFGSGVIISEEGHVITNHHVAGHATHLECTLSNREEIGAQLIGTDPLTDICIIKLTPDTPRKFPVAKFGDSTGVKVGDHVMSMGSPRALSQSVTLGIVSNTEMIMPRGFGRRSFRLDGENVGALVRWIAHDAVIYPGNSGGALVNLDGEIIGINEISLGLGGAIPGNLARAVGEAIIEHGEVARSWLGINVQPLLKNQHDERGILITGAIEGSPADRAGIESGDILLELAGRLVHVRFDEDLPAFNQLMADLPIGASVDAVVLRDGERERISMITEKREERRPKEQELKQWGITSRNLSYVISREMKRDTSDGVLVTSVRPGGAAGDAKPSIRRGDVIVAVSGTSIANIEELIALTEKLTADAAAPVPVLTAFERDAASYVTMVKVGLREMNDPGLEVKKAWLPVETQVITRDIAAQLGGTDLKGFRVTQVYQDSTADKAGLRVGDLITAVDDEVLTASAPEHYEELPALIRNYRAGTVADLTVVRDSETLVISVELVRSPKLKREMRKYRDENFEYTVRDTAFFDQAEEQWDDAQQGVLIDEVTSGGWAALGYMGVGDLIEEVDGMPIHDVDGLREAMERIAEEEPRFVVFKVLRGIYTLYLEIEPKWGP